MRSALLIIMSFIPNSAPAGFSTTCSPRESMNISSAVVERSSSSAATQFPSALEAELPRAAAQSTNHNWQTIDSALSVLSTPYIIHQPLHAKSSSNLYFKLKTPTGHRPDSHSELRLDISFDVNGVDMGEIGSVSGAPSSNGRQGLVRADGDNGRPLADHFSSTARVPLLQNIASDYQDTGITLAEELACLLFLAAAILSSLHHRRLLEQQQTLKRRAELARLSQAASDLELVDTPNARSGHTRSRFSGSQMP